MTLGAKPVVQVRLPTISPSLSLRLRGGTGISKGLSHTGSWSTRKGHGGGSSMSTSCVFSPSLALNVLYLWYLQCLFSSQLNLWYLAQGRCSGTSEFSGSSFNVSMKETTPYLLPISLFLWGVLACLIEIFIFCLLSVGQCSLVRLPTNPFILWRTRNSLSALPTVCVCVCLCVDNYTVHLHPENVVGFFFFNESRFLPCISSLNESSISFPCGLPAPSSQAFLNSLPQKRDMKGKGRNKGGFWRQQKKCG